MGLIRFLVQPAAGLNDWPEVYRGYLSGADGRIFPTRMELEGPLVVARRSTSESSKFHVSWPVPGFGRPVLKTASLPEREQPYHLAVELARGELVQLRNQAANWELAGMRFPQGYADLTVEAHRAFGQASRSQSNPEVATRWAEESLVATCRAASLLCSAFTQQALMGRQQRYPQLPASLGCGIAEVPTAAQTQIYTSAFNSVTIPARWSEIERVEGEYNWSQVDATLDWAEDNRLIARGGPLIDFGPSGLPEWLAQWEHDVFNLQSFICDFVETAMSRYLGRIRLWDVVARLNTGGALTLNEESRLSLTARILEVARQVDEEAQLILRIDQPWGEYQARGQHRLSPLQLVDALIRSGVGLAGVNLEISMGYRPRGTPFRNPLEFSRLVDQWSGLGVMLHITLTTPSGTCPDPLAVSDLEVESSCWPGGCNEESQADWLRQLVPLLMAKPSVASVNWSTLTDQVRHEFPLGGLFRSDGQPKAAISALTEFRKRLGKPGE